MAKIPTCLRKRGPKLHKGPDWHTAERSAGCIPLDYRPAVVGEKYLLVCERSLQLEREWAEAKLIVESESYTRILCQRPRCFYAVFTGGRCVNGTGSSKHCGSWHIDQRLGAGSRQTFCNGPHWNYHPISGDRGIDALKLHPKPKRRDRCSFKDARDSPSDGVHPYVAALQRRVSFAWRRYRID